MLVDADEFCQDVLDTTYGYAPSNHRRRKATPENNAKDESVEAKPPTSPYDASFSSTSFLRVEQNKSSPSHFVAETAIRAGCSRDAVDMAYQVEDSPNGIDELASKVSESDAALLSAQLDRELVCEWKSSSLCDGLDVDKSGLAAPDSILHIYDLLCNINLQLLVMQRELLKHESTVRELRGRGDLKAFGFEDANNIKQLRRLMRSLDISSSGIRDRLQSLSCALFGISKAEEKKSRIPFYATLPVSFAVLTLGWLIFRNMGSIKEGHFIVFPRISLF